METSNTAHGSDPRAAQAALDDIASMRGRVARRITSPWWYRIGFGLTLAAVLVGFGIGGTALTTAAGFGGIAVMSGLATRFTRVTGVSLDRYASRPGAVFGIGVVVLVIAGLAVRSGVGQWWATLPFAAALVVFTVLMEPRIDADVRRRLRGGA